MLYEIYKQHPETIGMLYEIYKQHPETIGMLYEIYKQHPEICIDSRKVTKESMFFALKGDTFDGNLYAADALRSGAAFAVVDNTSVVQSDRYIPVDNVLLSLQALATEHRRKLNIPIIALTGSNGKTTTKEFLHRVASVKFKVGTTQGNLNNHIGVPLTLLSFPDDTELGVVEMGANHRHEIAQLCAIAQPNLGLITNIGIAHLEGFGGVEGIIQAKGELYDYLAQTGGVAIYNAKDEVLSKMINERPELQSVNYDPKIEKLQLNIYGEYNQLNAQAAFAVGRHLGVDPEKSREAIRNYIPENNRSQIIKTDSNTLYMDAYNANPSSMNAAIDNFASLKEPHKIVILGEMLELGAYSDAEHQTLVRSLVGKFEQIFLVGKSFNANILSAIPTQYSANYRHFDGTEQLIEYLLEIPIRNKNILVKGSRGITLEKVVKYL